MAIRNVLSGLFTGFGEYARGMAVKQAEEKAKLEREQEFKKLQDIEENRLAQKYLFEGFIGEPPEGDAGTSNISTGGVGMQRGVAGLAGTEMQPQPTAAQVLPKVFNGQPASTPAGSAEPTVPSVIAGTGTPNASPQRPREITLGGRRYVILSQEDRAARDFRAATGMTRPEYEDVVAKARGGDKAAQSIMQSLDRDWLTPSEREAAREASQAARDAARLEAEARAQAARDAAELERIRLQNKFKTGLPAAMGDMQEQINDYVENYSMTPRPNDIIDMAKGVAIKYGVDSRIIERAFMPTLPPSSQGGR